MGKHRRRVLLHQQESAAMLGSSLLRCPLVAAESQCNCNTQAVYADSFAYTVVPAAAMGNFRLEKIARMGLNLIAIPCLDCSSSAGMEVPLIDAVRRCLAAESPAATSMPRDRYI